MLWGVELLISFTSLNRYQVKDVPTFPSFLMHLRKIDSINNLNQFQKHADILHNVLPFSYDKPYLVFDA